MKKFEIINQSVVVTDTVSGKTVFDAPKNDTYYNLKSLQDLTPPYIQLIDKSATNDLSGNYGCLLSEAVNSTLVAFTAETFKDFARENLGFKTASGGSGADKVNSITTGEPAGSDKVVNIVSLTQAEYNAGTKIPTTFYIITG